MLNNFSWLSTAVETARHVVATKLQSSIFLPQTTEVSEWSPMTNSRKDLFFALAMIVAGTAAFFLFLYLAGSDPDEQSLGVMEWVIGGILIGPGFGYLLRWSNKRGKKNDG